MNDTKYHDRGDGIGLAASLRPGTGPTLVFLPGYMSDMAGSKALCLDDWAAQRGHACLRFDYSGCGQSEGRFEDGSIGRWTQDALALIDRLTSGPVLLVGSSMGGWIALRIALARPDRVAGLVGIAAAPDFTLWGVTDTLSAAEAAQLRRTGRLIRPSDYGPEPYVYTTTLLDDGARQTVLDQPLPLACPVRLLQGQLDDAVPWQLALQLAAHIGSADVQVTLIKDGDHRLSRPADLALLTRTVESLLETA